MERTLTNLKDNGILLQMSWWKLSNESGHPIFGGISALTRGILKRQGGRCTIHFSAELSNAELLFRTIHSANQLSIYGAITDWFDQLTQRILGQSFLSMEKSVAKVNEQLSRNMELEEVSTLVRTLGTIGTNVQAARYRLYQSRKI